MRRTITTTVPEFTVKLNAMYRLKGMVNSELRDNLDLAQRLTSVHYAQPSLETARNELWTRLAYL